MYDSRNIGRSFDSINNEIRDFLMNNSPRNVYDDLLWTRELTYGAYDGDSGICDLVDQIVTPYNTSRLFVGHCPTMSSSLGRNPDPMAFCSRSFYVVDVGISRWMYANPRNVLLTIDDRTGETTSVETVVTAVPKGKVRITHPVSDTGDDDLPTL